MEENEVNNNEGHKEMNTPKKEYRTLLSPCNIPEDDTSHLAVDDLKFALKQSDSRNIAITGHFGSGKSSVANTCIDEMGIADKVLRISMSTFSLPTEDQNPNEIEYKIVQHLLYKCDKNKIPHSGFKRIHEPEERNYGRHIVYILIALACFVIAFEPSFLRIDSFYDGYYRLVGDNAGWWINLIADACSVGYLAWFLFWAGKIIASKLNQIKNIKIETKGVTLEASADVNVSVFNKYLDEIIYIIQENQYDYILFEDLDRLDNSDKLFLKIRELNMLINESEMFKGIGRIVRFIYAIRDDVFTRELRTKCFDYIVAVVPVVDHYNVTDYLIKQYKSKDLFKTVDTPVLEQLLSRVAGLRELKNIVNEYTLFQKSLKTHLSGDDENYEQKLLAAIVYKNLFPQDFAKAYLKQGLFYAVFKNKSLFSEDETKELREKVNASILRMNEAREKIINIRKQYLEKINDQVEVTALIKNGYDYTLGQVASRDDLFELFINDEFDRYTYTDHNHEETGSTTYNFVFDEIEKKVTEDIDYYEAIDKHSQAYNRSNDERLKLEKEIKVIENTALREVLRKIGGEKARAVFNKIYVKEYSAKENELQTVNDEMVDTLLTMIYGGYITEDYYLYISKFYEGSTSESDYQFTNAVLQGTERPYDQKLNNVKSVIRKFRIEDFKNNSILNYDILNYLLDNKEEHFLPSFIETARKNPEFIISYFQMSEKVNDQFFTHVFDGWNSCVNIIKGQEKTENSDALLKLFFREAPVSVKLSDEEIKYLEGKYDFLHSSIKFYKLAKLKKFINKYNLCFDSLVKPSKESQELYEYCLTNKRFVISKKNLAVILGDSLTKKPMTAILELPNDRLKKYLLNSQETITTWFETSCNEESKEALVYMIKEAVGDDEWLTQYLSQQLYDFDNVSNLDKRAVGLILAADKLAVAWHCVLGAYQVLGTLDDTLNDYLTRHAAVLSKERCTGDENLVTLMHKELFTGEKQPMHEFVKLLRSFDMTFSLVELGEMDDERTAEVIRQKKVSADSEIFDHLNVNCSDQVADDYLILHYDALMDDETIEWEKYMRNSMGIRILNSKLTLAQKKRFLNECLFITKESPDAWELAKLVCFYYNQCGVDGADKDLVVTAITIYQGEDSWEQKITLINKCNSAWEYNTERENKLLDGLGGEYHKLTYARGWASFDINEHNFTLLDYLKGKGHYISKVEEKEGQYYVTFKHS